MNIHKRALQHLAGCMTLLLVAGCSILPPLDDRKNTAALSQAEARTTKLGRALAPQAQAHPGKTGIYGLSDPHEAFAARALLARSAEKTLDIQYYIWHKDLTGTLLFEALHAAADRGVYVRFLLDDNNTVGLDPILSTLNNHPNIEVRLFNPFVYRTHRWLGYITDFSRANRRMHNKSFTADNSATIIGGRNVGDEYFGATDGVLFADLDVLAVGSVVNDVSTDFDLYWRSGSSYPVELLLDEQAPVELDKLAADAADIEKSVAASSYMKAVRQSQLFNNLLEGTMELEWSKVRMVSDHPDKGLGLALEHQHLTHELTQIINEPSSEVVLVSPYFVPTAAGVDAFVSLAEKGVQLKVLTNSLDATDVLPVHAGYAKRRKDLLEAGIKLFETKSTSTSTSPARQNTRFGSSGSSLHAKTFAVDRARAFVGSFNFDPRSAKLNTELGFVIESPTMAARISDAFKSSVLSRAYEVHLSDKGALYWTEEIDGKTIRHNTEPNTTFLQRAAVQFITILPVEWLL